MTGRRRGTWSTPERARLRALFPHTPVARLARLLGRSERAVLRCGLELLAAPPRRGPFTPADDELLLDGLGVHRREVLAKLLGRPPAAVDARLDELAGRPRRNGPWTSAEDRLLRRRYGSRSDEALALGLRRPVDSVRARARELCLAKDKGARAGDDARMPRWTAGEIARLRELYPRHDNLAVARALGRTVQSVASKANKLGLGKEPAALREMGRRNAAVRHVR